MVAAALKVPVRKLDALEADDIDLLPDAVFVRALASSVCRTLKIDPQPVLAKPPGAQRPGLADADRTISRSLKSAAPRSGSGASGLPSRTLLIVVVLLLLGAAVLFWLPQSAFDRVGAVFSGLGSHSDTTAATGTPAPGPWRPAVAPNAPPVLPLPADTRRSKRRRRPSRRPRP